MNLKTLANYLLVIGFVEFLLGQAFHMPWSIVFSINGVVFLVVGIIAKAIYRWINK